MPSSKKTLHFVSSGLLTSISVGLLGFAMSSQWSVTSMDCDGGSGFTNGTATVKLSLFNGILERDTCPKLGSVDKFQVFETLAIIDNGVGPLVLHGLSVGLLALCLLFSACSILISLYNSVSNPYETYMGPVGVYASSSLCACLSVLVLILFVLNLNVTSMQEDLVPSIGADLSVTLSNKVSTMQLGYYLVIPYTLLSLGAILLIYLYDHAAYTHRREQERPTEDAPKEIMMY